MLTFLEILMFLLVIAMAWCIGTAFSTLKLQAKMRVVLPAVVAAYWAVFLMKLWVKYLG